MSRPSEWWKPVALELQKALRFFPERAWNRTLRTSGLEKTHDRVWGCQTPRKRDWTKNCCGTWTCLARQGSRNNFQERRKKETELSIRYTKLYEDHPIGQRRSVTRLRWTTCTSTPAAISYQSVPVDKSEALLPLLKESLMLPMKASLAPSTRALFFRQKERLPRRELK